ncbi:MAG: nucleotidyltransferase [Chloroflexota bacterium]|nr:MAG: nucleotidyltransferase [Chloroflexota bacterium]
MSGHNVEFPMEAIRVLCQRYHVRELSVFGSVLREDFGPESDIDLLVEFEPDAQVSYLDLFRIQRELATILQRRVDLVPKRGLRPLIRESVLSSMQVLYAA